MVLHAHKHIKYTHENSDIFRGRKSNNHIECNFIFIKLDKFETHMKRKHYSGNWSKVTLEISTRPSHITRNGLKQEKFNCYQCNFTFAKIKLVLYTHDEKTLQRQLEQNYIGNLD